MYYLNYPTLKFVANMNLMMMEPEQKMQLSDKHNITEPLHAILWTMHEQLTTAPASYTLLAGGRNVWCYVDAVSYHVSVP